MNEIRSYFSKNTLTLSTEKKVYFVIPWRETPSRKKAFDLIINRYKSIVENANIITADSGSKIFNLSASRNLGLKQAFEAGADVVVLSDADVFVSTDALIESINHSLDSGVITNPYTVFAELTKESTEMFFNNDMSCMNSASWIGHVPTVANGKISNLYPVSGINVIPKTVWDTVGGFDENFVGWGPEDQAYLISYIKHYNDIYHFKSGIALSICHEKEWKDESVDNKKYFEEKYLSLLTLPTKN
jgi:predicted glycosyltransferase involved in capsule biosynthesis